MRTLLVGYDLNSRGQKYADLLAFLKAGGTWWHHLDSTLLLRTELSAAELRDRLVEYQLVDDNDELLVIDVSGDAAAWHGFAPRGKKWLKNNLRREPGRTDAG